MRTLALIAAVALLLVLPHTAMAVPYTVDTAASRIEFSASHAGTPFQGQFQSWAATIDFDPAAPQNTVITADIDMASASTGNKMFDGTLPNDDWFDTKNHPRATFKSTAVTQNADGGYQATGDLTLRGITKPVVFSFVLDDPTAAIVSATAELKIDRLDFDIGKKSDPQAEWVSRDIAITLRISAQRKG